MMQLVIYLIIAVVVIFVFNSVLGKPIGKMPDKPKMQAKPKSLNKQDKIMKGPASESLMKLASKDPSFDSVRFLSGANIAYEWIVKAFIEGNTRKMQKLVSEDVFNLYNDEIKKREKDYSVRLEELKILSADIDRAEIEDNFAYIFVRFKAIIKTREQKEDRLCLEDTEEIWGFKRKIGNKNPNWILDTVSHDA